jgi:DNA-binding XRE family transcriptional regulator
VPRREIPLADRLDDLEAIAKIRRLVREGRVKDIRLSAGVTQEEIADVVGCASSAISQYESGTRVPSGEFALRYAAAIETLSRGSKS